jgi:DNA mismatch repair protein MutL
MPIHLLPEEVASQIAAGEVVERPASVVKELLENALDAGARQVTVTVEGAGRRVIELADDGSGIPAAELALAVARHATSKLTTADDLFHIATLGFRGEALASIGSVAHLALTSRSLDATVGAKLRVEGGHIGTLETVGAPAGTVVRVEDLFYNVPARLKFLKSDVTERQQIDALVTRYAMAYPQVRMRLVQEGKVNLQTSGNGDQREVLAALYGVEVARQMLEVSMSEEGLRVAGFISPLALTRSNRKEITLFVNGRWVQDVRLATALLQAYHTLLMVGRFPLAVLFLTLPAEMVDVNVHPAKAEVRFRQTDQIFSGVQRAVRRALLAYSPVPSLAPAGTWMQTETNQATVDPDLWRTMVHPRIDPAWGMAGGLKGETLPATADNGNISPLVEGGAVDGQVQALPNANRLPLLRLIGQVGATYLVAEGPDGLYLIDQHAAHERVLFERFRNRGKSQFPSQTLLEPVIVQLAPQSSRLLEEQLPFLGRLGFQVDAFGPNTFLIRAIPNLISSSDPAVALRALVEDFEEDETPLQAEEEARLTARICKRVAVKAGQVLSIEEQRALLDGLEGCISPRTCPHGRPTMILLSADLLERQFGRKGAR